MSNKPGRGKGRKQKMGRNPFERRRPDTPIHEETEQLSTAPVQASAAAPVTPEPMQDQPGKPEFVSSGDTQDTQRPAPVIFSPATLPQFYVHFWSQLVSRSYSFWISSLSSR